MLLRKKKVHMVIGLLVSFWMSGCASTGVVPDQKDPWEKFNRAIYSFNDAADRKVVKPIAKGYRKVVPSPMRKSVGNFFRNLLEPTTIINDVLQGKLKRAGIASARFLANSTIGILGLFDVATHMGLERHREDFGQTLAVWGMKPGPYLMLPFLGPSNLRDGAGQLPYRFVTDPRIYLDDKELRWGLTAVDVIDTRAQLLGGGKLVDLQLDPYVFLREGYYQRRVDLIYDGDPPIDDVFDELDELEEEQ